jgi:HK97 family phage portal protein
MSSLAQEFRDFMGAIISFPQDFFGVFGLPPSESGSIVNEMSALQIAAYFACVRLISDAVGTLPLNVYERLSDGGERIERNHDLHHILHFQPNPEMCAADLRQAGQSHILMTGNCYIEIDWSKGGDVLGLYLRSPFSTFPYRRSNGDLIYKTHDNPNGAERIVESADMVHVKGLGIDGLLGLSPIKYYAREVLGNDIAAQAYSAKFFANGAEPRGVLQAPGNLTDNQKLSAMRTWLDAHTRGNNHRPAILEGGWKWEKTSVDPEEAMLIETRNLNRSQIGAMFGVFEHMIGGPSESQSNMEQKRLEFLTFTLKPWLRKWEQPTNIRLFPRIGRNAGKYFARFDTSELERADYADMLKGLQMGRYAGLLDRDEARKAMGFNPAEPKQTFLLPVNMVEVYSDGSPVIEAPPANPDGGGIGGNQSPAPGEENKSLRHYFVMNYPAFRDAFGRILARKKVDENDFQRTFSPVLIGIASALNFDPEAEPGEIVLSSARTQFIRDYISAMPLRAKDWTADKADKQAGDELTRAIKFLQDKIQPQESDHDEEN